MFNAPKLMENPAQNNTAKQLQEFAQNFQYSSNIETQGLLDLIKNTAADIQNDIKEYDEIKEKFNKGDISKQELFKKKQKIHADIASMNYLNQKLLEMSVYIA